MKTFFLFLLLLPVLAIAQLPRNPRFTPPSTEPIVRPFETEAGLYGKISVRPTTTDGFGRVISFKCLNISIEGVRKDGAHFYGNELADYGVRFPINNAKGFFIVNGKATVYVLSSITGDIKNGGSGGWVDGNFGGNKYVYHNIGASYPVDFDERTKQRIKDNSKDLERNVWIETGRVRRETVYINGINVSDRYGIFDAIKSLKKEEEKAQQFDDLMAQVNRASTNEQKLEILTKARQYASNNQKAQLENQISNVQNKIEQEKQERLAQNQQNQQNSQSQQTNSSSTDYWGTGNSSSRSTASNSSSNTRATETATQKGLREYNESVEKQNREREQTSNSGNYSSKAKVEEFNRKTTLYELQMESLRIEQQKTQLAYDQAATYAAAGNYGAAAGQYANIAIESFSKGDNISGIAAGLGVVASSIEQARINKQRRLERERIAEAKKQARLAAERRKKEAERKRLLAIKNRQRAFTDALYDSKIPLNYHNKKAYIILVEEESFKTINITKLPLYTNSDGELPYKQDILNKYRKKTDNANNSIYIYGAFESIFQQTKVYNKLISNAKNSLVTVNKINFTYQLETNSSNNRDYDIWGNSTTNKTTKQKTTPKTDFWD